MQVVLEVIIEGLVTSITSRIRDHNRGGGDILDEVIVEDLDGFMTS